ncbi:hypothetical protein CL689_00615 [Candidatus Saccharibacteria bacterium]|nr:hypothetical protein [Candidatus Saccharibacteria bacterium]MBJ58638.1 hypothetical protein [Candidatus Saccharibacteria bacterium]MBQ68552.1 hypothetical protein [Candidatus Saccharibacteria bacterium]|tara:strand:+ start:347 stop:1111 length:765 start_codon:yes stop_codon:yes gene_type:complete
MSENSSSTADVPASRQSLMMRLLLTIGLPIWVFVGFVSAQLAVSLVLRYPNSFGVDWATLGEATYTTVFGGVSYVLALLVIVGLPWLVFRFRTTKSDVGLQRWPAWSDIGIAPAGFLVYLVLTGVLIALAQQYLTFIDWNEAQDVGYSQVGTQFEVILAFLMLVIVAPIAEEIIFRGYLLGKLRKYAPTWLAILVTSILFGAVHGQLNVGIDTFALSIVMCLAVVLTKSLWPAILIHMMKNGLAFYFLFINPLV